MESIKQFKLMLAGVGLLKCGLYQVADSAVLLITSLPIIL
jgi:hypothetical protein